MKYAHYDKDTGKLKGFYDKTIHKIIPKPYIEISDEEWHEALSKNYNYVDTKQKKLGYKDFSSIEDIKKQLKRKIEGIYKNKLYQPVEFVVNNKTYTFQADKEAQDTLSKVITTADENFEIDWLDIDNNFVHMTLTDLKKLAQSILIRGQKLFKKKVILKKQVDKCKSKEELSQIDIEREFNE